MERLAGHVRRRVRAFDQSGENRKVVQDQQLNVVIEVDGLVDRDNPPGMIEVAFTTSGGTTLTLLVPWNGDRPEPDNVVDPFDPDVPVPYPAFITSGGGPRSSPRPDCESVRAR